jgi:hypothetical protein
MRMGLDGRLWILLRKCFQEKRVTVLVERSLYCRYQFITFQRNKALMKWTSTTDEGKQKTRQSRLGLIVSGPQLAS